MAVKEWAAINEMAGALGPLLSAAMVDDAVAIWSATRGQGKGRRPGGRNTRVSKLAALFMQLDHDGRRRADFEKAVKVLVMNAHQRHVAGAVRMTNADVEKVIRGMRALGLRPGGLARKAWRRDLVDAQASDGGASSAPAVPTTSGEAIPMGGLAPLRADFLSLHQAVDRQKAGLQLEHLLNRLFALFRLAPRHPFRVVGEQIDGSFDLDRDIYLLEAKWTAPKIDEADLLVFRGKVEGKSNFTRGLFLSVNGYTEDAVRAITQGKTPNFVMLDGAHLYRVLEGHVHLDALLRTLVRHLGETGAPYLPVGEL